MSVVKLRDDRVAGLNSTLEPASSSERLAPNKGVFGGNSNLHHPFILSHQALRALVSGVDITLHYLLMLVVMYVHLSIWLKIVC
jgi:hypothetical protein